MLRLRQCTAAAALVIATSTVAPAGENLLTNPEFRGADPNSTAYGDGWGSWGAVGFHAFWGPANPHASFFADWFDNVGYVWQQGLSGTPGVTYQFDLLDTRVEANWDADFYYGLEYYDANDAIKVGETLVLMDADARIANGQIDGNVFSMQGTAPPGTVYVRPIMFFVNVNPAYEAQSQANAFVFNTYMSVAPAPAEEHLKNPDFFDVNGDGALGDYWGRFGNVDVNEFFGPANPHVSFFADTIGNSGYVWQQAVLAAPGTEYEFQLTNVRIEANFDADLYFGLEYYGNDDFTKIGETIVQADTSVPGDGLSYSVNGTAVAGTVYVRPVMFFDNVGTTGGDQRNAFIFATSLVEAVPSPCTGDLDGDNDVDLTDLAMLLSDFDCTGGCSGDVDGDGDTDLTDLAMLLADFDCGT